MCPICPSLYLVVLGLWEQICIRWWRRWLQSLLRTRRQGVVGWTSWDDQSNSGAGCTFKMCPPANDRWHPWPFFRRWKRGRPWIWDLLIHWGCHKDHQKIHISCKGIGKHMGEVEETYDSVWFKKGIWAATMRDMLVKPLVLASLCSANQYLNLFKFHTDTAKMSSRLRTSQH